MARPDHSTLGLAPAIYPRREMPGDHPRRYFLDFVIDGASLLTTAQEQDRMVTDLCSAWPASNVEAAIQTLLGLRATPDLESGRVALLVCSQCGDLGCGQVTAGLALTENEVTWTDFRWETGYDAPQPFEVLPPTVSFDRVQYEALLASAAERVAALPTA